MAYMSDIDLATLHKTRLEEKVNYKLSWWANTENHMKYNNNLIDGCCNAKPPSKQYNCHTKKKPVMKISDIASTTTKTINNNSCKSVNKSNNLNKVIKNTSKVSKKSSTDQTSVDDKSVKQDTNQNEQKLRSNNERCESIGKQIKKKYEYNSSLDIDDLSDDGYFSSETRRRRSGTWPRTRSLNAPSPFQQFGPCGRIMKNSAMVMQIQDPASQRLTWYKPPLAVLVIKKIRDPSVLSPFVQLVEWLIDEKHMVVWVEAAVLDDQLLLENKRFLRIKDKLVTFKDGRDDLTDRIDFIICLGGDGTLLYASLLFQQSVPPVMAFHLGSLGFLTPFQFDNFEEQVTNVLEGHAALTLRSRLRCIIVRRPDSEEKEYKDVSLGHDNYTVSNGPKPSTNILVLNEVVIDRGPSPYLSNIDLFLDGKHITSVQGDGLIVSTPTGSTAYAVAAGASMIHPSVPAIMVTPICPHSLSFRPIVVPAGVELKISISPDSRNTSWVSFDGRSRQELRHGDSLRVTTSIYPVPSICAQDQISDWFDSLAECLHWNVRKRQKCLDELSDLTGSGSEDTLDDLDRRMESLEA